MEKVFLQVKFKSVLHPKSLDRNSALSLKLMVDATLAVKFKYFVVSSHLHLMVNTVNATSGGWEQEKGDS